MHRVLTWEEATRLADTITLAPDAGAWHARVGAVENGHAVVVRQHNTHTLHYISSMAEFTALCDQAAMRRR